MLVNSGLQKSLVADSGRDREAVPLPVDEPFIVDRILGDPGLNARLSPFFVCESRYWLAGGEGRC